MTHNKERVVRYTVFKLDDAAQSSGTGNGPKNKRAALKLYQRALENGNWTADLRLGEMYRDGEGTQR